MPTCKARFTLLCVSNARSMRCLLADAWLMPLIWHLYASANARAMVWRVFGKRVGDLFHVTRRAAY